MASTNPVLHFGTDGVRGRADQDLKDDAVRRLGRATARVLGTGHVFLIGRDTRESGPAIERALATGLTEEGGRVESVGVLPTPGLAYLSQARMLPAAMISASHNPFHDNGIKLFGPGGRKLADDLEAAIEGGMAALSSPSAAETPAAASTDGDADAAREEYLGHLIAALEGRRLDGLRVVLDCAHGAAFRAAPEVFERLGTTAVILHADPDGRNINAGCGSTHPEALQSKVVEIGADAGLAFDGDADRLIAVDEAGHLVDGDHFLAISALDLRERGRLHHDTVVTTVMANLGFRRAMESRGLKVVETKVGDRSVLEAMDQGGYALGGEQSGHVIFADLATTGDGILSGLVLLDILARSGRPLSALASVVTKLPQVLESVRVADRSGLDRADGFWREVASIEEQLAGDGRVLVRPSGTEPVVRIMVEAPTEELAGSIAERLNEALVSALGGLGPTA